MKVFKKTKWLLLIIFLFIVTPVYSYVIDGDVSDWGIDLLASGADEKGYLDENLPSGGWDIDYVTEDNADINKNPARNDYWWEVGPGWSWYNYFDVEAIYFDNDSNYAYIAIVQGLPEYGVDPPYNTVDDNLHYVFKPGDIAIDVGSDGSYEYGVDIDSGILYKDVTWQDAIYYFPEANPWAIESGTVIGNVSLAYSRQNSHYVIETAIPLSYLGLNAGGHLTIHWTMECGNDYLNLDATVVPEPATLLLLGTGLIAFGISRRKKT